MSTGDDFRGCKWPRVTALTHFNFLKEVLCCQEFRFQSLSIKAKELSLPEWQINITEAFPNNNERADSWEILSQIHSAQKASRNWCNLLAHNYMIGKLNVKLDSESYFHTEDNGNQKGVSGGRSYEQRLEFSYIKEYSLKGRKSK